MIIPEKIENIKRPIKKGELYLVPCLIKIKDNLTYITPIINHPHNDIENGQKEVHYHVDYRFIKHFNDGDFPTPYRTHSKHVYINSYRPILHKEKEYSYFGDLETLSYYILPVINEDFKGITPVEFIKKSKLKYKCIHKGKCPHRGYNLSQVKEKGGIITCPLHGLKFNAKTKKLIKVKS